jgi:sigma-B regulation protein RsbQ
MGAGGSDLTAYDKSKYSTLNGYADDLVEIGLDLGLKDAVFVGHSVSAMIGLLASFKAPDMFKKMMLVGPSPRYIDTMATTWAASARSRSRNRWSSSKKTT